MAHDPTFKYWKTEHNKILKTIDLTEKRFMAYFALARIKGYSSKKIGKASGLGLTNDLRVNKCYMDIQFDNPEFPKTIIQEILPLVGLELLNSPRKAWDVRDNYLIRVGTIYGRAEPIKYDYFPEVEVDLDTILNLKLLVQIKENITAAMFEYTLQQMFL